MAFRAIEQAEHELGDLFEGMLKAVGAANAHMWRTYANDMHRTSGRSRANLLCDWIGDELGKEWTGKAMVQPVVSHGVKSYAVGQNWLVRVHKMDEGCGVASNDTQLRLALDENDLGQAQLFGLPESATVLYLGYIENVADPLYPEVWLTCPDGEKAAWEKLLGTSEPPVVVELTPTEPQAPETQIVPKPVEKPEADDK